MPDATTDTDPLITLREASALTGIPRPTLRRWCDQGRLPSAVKQETLRGAVWLVKAADVEKVRRGKGSLKTHPEATSLRH